MERGGGSTTSKPGTSPRVIAGAVSSNSIYPLEMTKREKIRFIGEVGSRVPGSHGVEGLQVTRGRAFSLREA